MWALQTEKLDFSAWTAWVLVGGVGVAFLLAVFLLRKQSMVVWRAFSALSRSSLEPVAVKSRFVFGSVKGEWLALRRRGNPVAVLISDATATAPPRPGAVIDRSLGGLGLAMDVPAQVGTILTVRPASSPSIPWLQVVVRGCRQREADWRVGCQFVRTPPSSVLCEFG